VLRGFEEKKLKPIIDQKIEVSWDEKGLNKVFLLRKLMIL
jgi:hypothetical protein